MLTWVVYDIAKDRTRTRIAKRCLDFGLYRVQKSVYLGDIAPNRVEEVLLFSREPLSLDRYSVYVFPLCREDFGRVRIVGQAFDGPLGAAGVVAEGVCRWMGHFPYF